MSAGAISLESALRTCKVNPEWANRLESHRIIGPASEKTCPLWTGFDLAGRPVCPDSFNTKSAGCNSALDRLHVENEVSRPQYVPYINLSMEGITGEWLYDERFSGAQQSHQFMNSLHNSGGTFGQQLSSYVKPGGMCTYDSYQQAQAQNQQSNRQCQSNMLYANNSPYRELGGYY
jgi:hypothetical protein